MLPELAANIACRQAPRLLADAAALARVCAAADLERLHIADISDDAHGLTGYSFGSGHQLAVAMGWRDGQPAIGVAVRHLVAGLASDDLALARAAVEQTALHELAHSLVGQDRRPAADLVRLVAHLRAVPEGKPTDQRPHHHLRWAACLVILSQRAAKYRPATADLMWRMTERDLERYGHSCRALRLLCRSVDPQAALRPLLTAGSDLMATLARVGLPDCPQLQQGAAAACA